MEVAAATKKQLMRLVPLPLSGVALPSYARPRELLLIVVNLTATFDVHRLPELGNEHVVWFALDPLSYNQAKSLLLQTGLAKLW
ncbi:hypothetical protein LCGC14_2051480 [marine sediment metagenome]|uniref:Uncharacterized protein n=1 Tax=marine sediment metagenome TaxID=412755 RepID=A0A0F9FBC7_9ZZZZ